MWVRSIWPFGLARCRINHGTMLLTYIWSRECGIASGNGIGLARCGISMPTFYVFYNVCSCMNSAQVEHWSCQSPMGFWSIALQSTLRCLWAARHSWSPLHSARIRPESLHLDPKCFYTLVSVFFIRPQSASSVSCFRFDPISVLGELVSII